MMNSCHFAPSAGRCVRASAAAGLLSLSLSTSAQQVVTGAPLTPAVDAGPVTVEVRGMAEILGALQRLEAKLDRLLDSRWEYTFVQRNRLRDQEQNIRSFGAQGWELVNVTVEEGFIFKRRAGMLR